MQYMHTIWNHNDPNDPVFLYYEIDTQGFITRQIELYADFTATLTSKQGSTGDSFLSYVELDIAKIIAQNNNELTSFVISSEQFHHVWQYFNKFYSIS